MSISLQNHENRIKALENGKVVGIKRFHYASNTNSINVTSLISEGFNCFIPFTNPSVDHDNHMNTPMLIPENSSAFASSHHYEFGNNVGYHYIQLQNGIIESWVTGSSVSKPWIYAMIALKLCYNFSYNIYAHKLFTPLKLFRKEVLEQYEYKS